MSNIRPLPQLAALMLFRLRNDPSDEVKRIVWTGKRSLYTYFVPLSGEEWTSECLTEELRLRLSPEYSEPDALEFVSEDPYAKNPQADPSQAALERMGWIEGLVKDEKLFYILSPSCRGSTIKNHALTVGKSRTTIAFQLKRFLSRGMTASALEGDSSKCGGRGKQKNPKSKVGRRRTLSAGVGTPVNDSNRSILEVAACQVLGKPRRKIQEGLDYINETICRDWPVSERFTVRQLQYYLDSTRPYTQRKRKQRGDRKFNLSMRQFSGTSDTYGPGAQYQIDSTIGDVYLVSEFNILKVVGRPTIYIMSDTFSRLIVAGHISYSPPSIEGAALALECMITPKVALCAEYGIDIEEESWPAHYLPAQILADRGAEFTSVRAWDRLIQRLLIDVSNTVAFRPDWKSIVESRFNLIAGIWGEFVPGYVDKDFKERGAADYRLDATLTLREFTTVFLISIIEYNNRPLRTKKQIPEMVAAQIAPTPVELWNFGISRYSGVLRMANLDEMRACVFPRGTANVSHLGIGFATRYYETATALKEEWFDKARRHKFEVEVAYDPVNPSKLFVINQDGSFERATARKTGPQYDNIVSLSEIVKFTEDSSVNLNAAFDKFEPLKLDLRDKADAIIKEARRKREIEMETSGAKKVDIKQIRKARGNERALEAAILSGDPAGFSARPKSREEVVEEPSAPDSLGDISVVALKQAKRHRHTVKVEARGKK